jgi:pimeloyl-ACP methyl ester carboxylesterase
MNEPTTHKLDVPGAVLTYDLRGRSGGEPILFLSGSPMGASAFGTWSGHFPDRCVVTYDPRGTIAHAKV